MKNSIEHLDHQIRQWQAVVDKYPQAVQYKETLAKLQQERTNLVNLMGRRK